LNILARKMRQEIERNGPITFARFMEIALYEPGLGYYEQPHKIGRAGDYFTSVSTGPLFGRLLAFQFAQWLDSECPNDGIQLVEAGAHDGQLAADILAWFEEKRPDLLRRLEYWIVDPSIIRRGWQKKALSSWSSIVKWTEDVGDFAARSVNGIIFSNEFFDALPVHRLAWDSLDLRWRECRVKSVKDSFVWCLGDLDAALIGQVPNVPHDLAKVLPEGFITEVCPAATKWWTAAAQALEKGKLLAIDYGFHAENPLRPDRPHGTLRAFSRHHGNDDLLANPGEQDLTSDVNFFALEQAGKAAGLDQAKLLRQSAFLVQAYSNIHESSEYLTDLGRKTMAQFQTLTHPEHLGHRFQVLTQYRSIQSGPDPLPSSNPG
jgi:SAM-dependent MidA family methyltransferase